MNNNVIRKNIFNIDHIKSERIKYIIKSPNLRRKLEALILLESKDILTLFCITKEELQEYKYNMFDVDFLIELGRPYILDYLEQTRQSDILRYFVKGEAYTKARLGLAKELNSEESSILFNQLINSTLLDCMDEKDVTIRLKGLRVFNKQITPPPKFSVMEQLAEIMKEEDL